MAFTEEDVEKLAERLYISYANTHGTNLPWEQVTPQIKEEFGRRARAMILDRDETNRLLGVQHQQQEGLAPYSGPNPKHMSRKELEGEIAKRKREGNREDTSPLFQALMYHDREEEQPELEPELSARPWQARPWEEFEEEAKKQEDKVHPYSMGAPFTTGKYVFCGPTTAISCKIVYDKEEGYYVARSREGFVGTSNMSAGEAALMCFQAWMSTRHCYFQQDPEYGGGRR